MTKNEITASLVASLLDYDPLTGKLLWKMRDESCGMPQRQINGFNSRFSGRPAFDCLNSRGYLQAGILGHKFTAHRVAWAIHFKRWPILELDHINGVRTDNRIANLREVATADNRRNAARYRNNTSGVTGVYWYKPTKRWMVHIRRDGRAVNLGYYRSFDEAVAVRRKAECDAGFHPNHGREQTPPA